MALKCLQLSPTDGGERRRMLPRAGGLAIDSIVFVCVRRRAPKFGLDFSHGENRGSSPLGSASKFKYLRFKRSSSDCISPTFLQRTARFCVSRLARLRHRLWSCTILA